MGSSEVGLSEVGSSEVGSSEVTWIRDVKALTRRGGWRLLEVWVR